MKQINKSHHLYDLSFKNKTMSHKKVVRLFAEMDSIMDQAIDVIMQVSSFVDYNGADLIWEITSTANNRNIYRKMECRHRKTTLLSAEDTEFITRGFDFLRALAHNKRTEVRLNFTELRLLRSVYEEIVYAFLKRHDTYMDLHAQNLMAHNKWVNSTTDNSALLKDLSDRMAQIEQDLCTNRTYLYGLLRWIKEKFDAYSERRNRIVQSYLRIVFSMASDFAVDDYTLTDHYQVGTLGLMRSISNYNPLKGSFSGYAKLWIRQAILSAIKDMNIIKIPASTWQCFTTLERKRSMLRVNDLHRLSILTGVSTDRISDVYDKVRTSQVCRLDEPVDDDNFEENSDSCHHYEEIIEDKENPVDQEALITFDHIQSTLAKKLMVCCHGDVQELVSMVTELPCANDISVERIRQRLAVL
jgi:RNA polymerase sigma factor (sigma-70 family)